MVIPKDFGSSTAIGAGAGEVGEVVSGVLGGVVDEVVVGVVGAVIVTAVGEVTATSGTVTPASSS